MKFTKMHGTGNDYVFVNCLVENIPDRAKLARRISDRHFGIGSDGLICICPSDTADFMMDMYNLDGSSGMMCGNGIRCVGKFIYDKGLSDKTELVIETRSGLRAIRLNVEKGTVKTVRVAMGSPEFSSEKIPIISKSENYVNQPLEIDEVVYNATALSVGNPHCVIFLDDMNSIELSKIGPQIECHPMFPERVNVEFIEVIDSGHLRMRVWERGSGITLACGTGATASVCAAALLGYTGNEVVVTLDGGNLIIEWDREADMLYMTGPAETVFEGEYPM